MNRQLFSWIFFCYYLLIGWPSPGIVTGTNPTAAAETGTSSRNTKWFEDTIGDFIRTAQDTNEGADIQISTCKISSQQLVATAQATAARVLKGVCNPSENEERFRNLEDQLDEQLNGIRTIVQNLEDSLRIQQQELKAQYTQLLQAISSSASVSSSSSYSRAATTTASYSLPSTTPPTTITTQRPTFRTYTLGDSEDNRQSSSSLYSSRSGYSNIPNIPAASAVHHDQTGSSSVTYSDTYYTPRYIPSVPHRAQAVTHESEEDYNNLSFETTGNGNTNNNGATGSSSNSISSSSLTSTASVRLAEIQRYNSTIHIENGKRVFSYYWIVSGMSNKLTNWNLKHALRSNSFYIFPNGYSMYLKIIPRYLTNTMYIHVGLTKGTYDDNLEWPFTKTMRVSVLIHDESRAKAGHDLKSRIWNPRDLCSGTNWRKPVYTDNPECVGLGFPHDVINSPLFIVNDQIVIKLTVFLD